MKGLPSKELGKLEEPALTNIVSIRSAALKKRETQYGGGVSVRWIRSSENALLFKTIQVNGGQGLHIRVQMAGERTPRVAQRACGDK